jgi:hypothetical protein
MVQVKTADPVERSEPKPRVRSQPKTPTAGPHAKPELTDKDKTPGSGVLPEADETRTEAPTG